MTSQNLENEILERVKDLNALQRYHVLDYIEKIPRAPHSTRRYRRRAMQQIREALENQ